MLKYFFFLMVAVFIYGCNSQAEPQAEQLVQKENQQTKSGCCNHDVNKTAMGNSASLQPHNIKIALHADSLYACPMGAEYVTSDPHKRCAKCGMMLKPGRTFDRGQDLKSKARFSCPMHPEFVTSDENDLCPFCQMKAKAIVG